MGVYIKGIDMPKKCCDCIFARDSGLGKDMVACIAVQGMVGVPKKSGKSEACPLVEVPKHGKLIDLNELGIGMANRKVFTVPEYADGWNEAIRIVYNAPVVIEGDK